MYDFNRLLGSIGGSLGMFVGLSFMDFAQAAIRRALECCRRNKMSGASLREKLSGKDSKHTSIYVE